VRWIVAFALVALAGRARADEGMPDPDTEQAQQHFNQGAAYYSAHRYEEAVREFEQARALKALPALDYNIGRTHDRLGHTAQAIAAYERYVSATPEPPDAAAVRERIAQLRARAPAPPDPAAGRVKKATAIALATFGLGSVIVAAAFAGLAESARDDLTNPPPGRRFDPALEDRMQTGEAVAAACFTVGGAALIAGVALYAVGWRESHPRVTLAPTVGRGLAALSLGFEY
jgi:tetratricopeptide (TPR) repeat protein